LHAKPGEMTDAAPLCADKEPAAPDARLLNVFGIKSGYENEFVYPMRPVFACP